MMKSLWRNLVITLTAVVPFGIADDTGLIGHVSIAIKQ